MDFLCRRIEKRACPGAKAGKDPEGCRRALDRLPQRPERNHGDRCNCRRSQSRTEGCEGSWLLPDTHGAKVCDSVVQPLTAISSSGMALCPSFGFRVEGFDSKMVT